jgi:outer membrane biosynthesis protein TonB
MTQTITKTVKKEEQPLSDREPPLMFVDVNPQQATSEPPRNAAFYSDKNSQAANREADKDTGVPKITGTQTHVPKAEDVDRNKITKLQPAPPAEREQPAEEARPKPVTTPGDLVMAKPELNPRLDNGTADQSKPRTIKEAHARQPSSQVPGQKMKQEGGVRRVNLVPSFDAKVTPYGAYDAALVAAISQRWFDLLDSREFARDRSGRVVLQFHLNSDGRITDMKVMENTVGEVLSLVCQKAVLDPAPFEKWPSDMRREFGEDYRILKFAFYYD